MSGGTRLREGASPLPRSGAVDFLKAFAVIGVIVIHVSAGGLGTPMGSFDWFSALFWGSITRASVPVFLMVTGALMLDSEREVSLREVWGRRIPRLLLALMVWAMVYRIWDMAEDGVPFTAATLAEAVRHVLVFHHQNHLYYLHIALLVYALVPVSRVITAHGDRRTLEYLLGVWVVLGIIYPTLEGVWPLTLLRGIPRQYGLNLTYAGVGYGLLGWYLRKYAARPWRWGMMALIGFLVTFGGSAVLSLRAGEFREELLEGASPGVALLAAGICGWAFSALRERSVPKAVELLAKASFCVYLVHLIFYWELGKMGLSAVTGPCAVFVPLTSAAVLLCSLAMWAVLRRIPVVRDWLI